MTLLLLASATDIAQWAATRASQDRVPELLRRLVYATTDAPQYINFPFGDAVQLDGWDGAVELDEDHAMIPRGLSVWEIGTGANPKKMADDDYAKRTAAPPNTARGTVAPQDTTFVFVTRAAGARKRNGRPRVERSRSGAMCTPLMRTISRRGYRRHPQPTFGSRGSLA